MANLVDTYVVQHVSQVEIKRYDDGTTKHRLLKGFSTIIGEPKQKKETVNVESVMEETGYMD